LASFDAEIVPADADRLLLGSFSQLFADPIVCQSGRWLRYITFVVPDHRHAERSGGDDARNRRLRPRESYPTAGPEVAARDLPSKDTKSSPDRSLGSGLTIVRIAKESPADNRP
jgi:hypothetical protein